MNENLFVDDALAKFKIEIHFGPDRTTKRDFRALVLLMESGKFFHGGGDGQMYVCLDHRLYEKDNTTPPSVLPQLRQMMKERTEYGCGAPIGTAQIAAGIALCTSCNRRIDARYLTGQMPFYGSIQELAELTEILFRRLGSDADVYCKYHPKDIRYRTQAEMKGVEEARRRRALLIYPLRNILKDTTAGASLVDRFVACFRA